MIFNIFQDKQNLLLIKYAELGYGKGFEKHIRPTLIVTKINGGKVESIGCQYFEKVFNPKNYTNSQEIANFNNRVKEMLNEALSNKSYQIMIDNTNSEFGCPVVTQVLGGNYYGDIKNSFKPKLIEFSAKGNHWEFENQSKLLDRKSYFRYNRKWKSYGYILAPWFEDMFGPRNKYNEGMRYREFISHRKFNTNIITAL